MARHTHIVSLGLFHKTFHSSLLQETFCFLMYDVLLSIYKINLIKKNKSCGIYVWQPLFTPFPFKKIHDHQYVWSRIRRVVYVISKFRINVLREFLHFCIPNRSPICVMIKTYLYTPRAVQYPSIKDKRVTKFFFDPFGWPEDASTCRGSLLDLAPFEAISRTIPHNYANSFW